MGLPELEVVRKYLVELEEAREAVIKVARRVSQLARKVVSSTTRRRRDEAEGALRELSEAFASLLGVASRYAELRYSNLFYSVAAEYVEAVQLHSVVFGGGLRPPDSLGVHPIPYVLGLLDLIGELKRLSLEHLRREEYDESFKYLELAERVYEEVLSLDVAESVVPGLRRKLDVYRKVIDDWRALLVDVESRLKLGRRCEEIASAVRLQAVSKG